MNTLTNKIAAIGAVFVMIATAFAGLCMMSDGADGSSNSNPQVGLSITQDVDSSGSYVIYKGTYVDLYFNEHDEWYFSYVAYKTLDNWRNSIYVNGNGTASVNGLTIDGRTGHVYGYITATTGIEVHVINPDAEIEDYFLTTLYVYNYLLDVNIEANQSYSQSISMLDYADAEDIHSVSVVSGSLPSGISVGNTYDTITFTGTPTSVGTYYATVSWEGYNTEVDETIGDYEYIRFVVSQTDFTHTVAYDANGGSGSTANTVVTDQVSGASNVTLASNGFTKSGYHFIGWKIGNTVYQPGQTVSVNGNASVTATAQWEQNTLTLGTIAKQYAVAGKSVSFNASATSNPSGATITFAKSNASSGLNVSISGNVVTCSAANAGTYTFTLTAIASGYTSSSTTVTVQVVPVLAFTNSPSAGALNA